MKYKKTNKINWKVLVISLVIVYAVAFLGSIFTEIGPWYETIKPSITPPNWVFPVVWTILFFLIGLSLYYSWTCSHKDDKNKLIAYYSINFLLNILWSYLYFGAHNVLFALLDLFVLWVSIIFLIAFNWRVCKRAGYLLIPYLLWVSFAGILNYLSIK